MGALSPLDRPARRPPADRTGARFGWVVAGGIATAVILLVLDTGVGALDLSVYRVAERALLGRTAHPQGLYGVRSKAGLPYTYPPFAALVMAPLAFGTAAVVVRVVRMLLCFALAGLCQTSLRAAGYRVSWVSVTVATLASLAFESVKSDIHLGQLSLVIVLMIVADLTGAVPARYRGVLTGLAAGLKLTPLVFVLLLAATRQRAALVRMLSAFAGTVLLGFAFLPRASWHYWTKYAYESRRVGPPWDLSDQSVRGTLSRLGLTHHSVVVHLLTLAAMLACAGAALVLGVLWWRRGEHLLGVALTGVASLLASPISWTHHWCWVVPLVLALSRLSYLAAALAAVPYLVTLRLSNGFNWRHQVRHWDAVQNLLGNAYVWGALLILGYAAWRLLRESHPPSRRDTRLPT